MDKGMLVLTRRRGQRVLLYQPSGELLGEVKVLDIQRDQVKLGFTAPREIAIWREEIDPNRQEGNR